MALTDNLVAYWKMDESSGDLIDATGNGNTMANGGSSGATFATGKINNGSFFTNAYPNNVANFTRSNLTTDLSAFSINVWFKSNYSTSDDTMFFSTGSWSGSGSFAIGFRAGVPRFEIYGPSPDEPTIGSTNQFDNSWKMYTATYDATAKEVRIYINNVLNATKDYSSLPSLDFTGLTAYIGQWLVGGNYRGFQGGLDEMAIFAEVLSSTERAELYNDGAGFAHPFTSATNNGAGFLMLMI